MLSKYGTMLLRTRKQAILFNTGKNIENHKIAQRSFATPAVKPRLEKDYYTILDIPETATPEQIKEQYRRLAKKYHPDVRTSEKGIEHQPNADMFRDVAEAYQVLSVAENRASYDLSRKKNPDLYKGMSEF